ncbi:PilW family protein [Rhodoferax sp.]|uniref:PilW family protein n=1 Tax=Rhodoferax sp. TaxID=50421 RepID=UPI00374CCC55
MKRPNLQRQRGVTLVELMVALLIGMILALAMFTVMATTEGRKRTLTSVNDVNQAGNYAMLLLDHWLRNAGSGFNAAAAYSFGCTLTAYQSSQSTPQILPASAKLPTPFASVNPGTSGTFKLAPVLILPNQTTPNISGATSDALVVMTGASGVGENPTLFSKFASVAQLNLLNTVPFSGDDLVLVAQVEPSASTTATLAPCLVDQVASGFVGSAAGSMALDGTYHSAASALASMSSNSAAMPLGNVVAGRPPVFQVIGVGDNNTLYSYDLLNTAGDSTRTAQARADGVFELHALYGIDKNCDGKISSDEWVKPTDSTYSLAALMAGTVQEADSRPATAAARLTKCSSLTTANDYLQKILAIRVGLILRTSLPEKQATTAQNAGGETTTGTSSKDITLFADLGSSLTYTRSLTAAEKLYRYRTLESTIPVRNPMLLP